MYKAGDKVKVVHASVIGSGGSYSNGAVFVVEEVENDVITTTTPATAKGYNGNIQLYLEEVELYIDEAPKDYEEPSFSSSSEKIEAPKLWGNGAHGIYTPGLRSPEKEGETYARDEWEGMADVGKEVIYDDYNTDSVEHPAHYTQGGVEVIEIIAQTVSGYDDGFTAHCVGTATKYLNRAPHKHETPLEDLKKAAKYLEFAIAHEEKKRI